MNFSGSSMGAASRQTIPFEKGASGTTNGSYCHTPARNRPVCRPPSRSLRERLRPKSAARCRFKLAPKQTYRGASPLQERVRFAVRRHAGIEAVSILLGIYPNDSLEASLTLLFGRCYVAAFNVDRRRSEWHGLQQSRHDIPTEGGVAELYRHIIRVSSRM